MNAAVMGREKKRVSCITREARRLICRRLPIAAASASSGTRRLEKDVRKADGKVRMGMTMASIMPYWARALWPVAPYFLKPLGMRMFSMVTSADRR